MNNLGFEPHIPVNAENFFTNFVAKIGGELISSNLPPSPSFDNADFYFPEYSVVAELKCIQTDFPNLNFTKINLLSCKKD